MLFLESFDYVDLVEGYADAIWSQSHEMKKIKLSSWRRNIVDIIHCNHQLKDKQKERKRVILIITGLDSGTSKIWVKK